MQKHEKQAVEAVTEVALAVGLSIEVARSNSKVTVWIKRPDGVSRKLQLSNSPKDRDNMVKNARSKALQLARQLLDT